MTAHTVSTRGQTLGYGFETAFGAGAAAYGEIRPESNIDWPTDTVKMLAQPNLGHSHPLDISDLPVTVDAMRENALGLEVAIRRSASANTAPIIADIFESMGCHVKTTTATTVKTFTSVTTLELNSSGAAYGAVGDAIMPLLDYSAHALDNYYFPTLVAAKAADVVTLGMGLPTETDETEPVEVITTIWPEHGNAVDSTKTLAWYWHTRGDSAGDGTEKLAHLYTACSGGSVDEITLEPATVPKIKFNMHAGKITRSADALAVETFVDGEKIAVVTEKMRVGFASANASGGITRAEGVLRSAKINLGVTSKPRKGFGSGTVSDCTGYDCIVKDPKVTITVTYGDNNALDAASLFSDMEGTFTERYLSIVQPTSALTTPAFGFWFPRVYIDPATPPKLNWDEDILTATATFICSTAGYTSTTNTGLAADEGYAPWYFAISGAAS